MVFCGAKFFCYSRPFFASRNFLHGTTIVAKIGQAVVDLKLDVNCELVLAHCHVLSRKSSTQSDSLKVNALSLF